MTTVRRPVEKMAVATAELLAARLQGADPEPERLLLRPELVVRASA
ncbi:MULTISPECIES: substrate-binding domain-containing protein [Streptomyces]